MHIHRKNLDFSEIFGYLVAFITICGGLIILINVLGLQVIPFVRYTFGIVIVLIGIYRFVITKIKYQADSMDNS